MPTWSSVIGGRGRGGARSRLGILRDAHPRRPTARPSHAMRIAIIGGLAAGPAAAAEASRLGAEVVLFEQQPHVSVGACEMPYYVGGTLKDGATLEVFTPEALARKKGITVHVRHRVTAIDPARGRLTVDALDFGSTREETFDRFILATGARARRLGVPGDGAPGVFSLRHLADALDLDRWLNTEDVRHVVIAGGGYVGLEMAEAMRDRGLRATILDPAGRVLPTGFEAAVTGQMQDAVRAAGVAVRAERVTEVRTDAQGRVAAVRTDRGEIVGCQALIAAIGVEPRTELARAAGLTIGASGGIWTDAGMRTSARTVWACGDVAEVYAAGRRRARGVAARPDGAADGARRGAQRGVARRDGRNVCRRDRRRRRARVRRRGRRRSGVTLPEALEAGIDAECQQIRGLSRVGQMPGAVPLDVRLVAERGSGRLLGGQLCGREGAALRADVLVPLVRLRATARDLAEDMDLLYTPPVAPAVDPLRHAAEHLQRALDAAGPRSRRSG